MHEVPLSYAAWLGFTTRASFSGDRQRLRLAPIQAGPDDLAVMPYTSGTTDHPKGCMHTHRSVMYNTVAGTQWLGTPQDEQEIIDRAHGHMAAYKSLRLVSCVDRLPKSGTGKVQWRSLQDSKASAAP